MQIDTKKERQTSQFRLFIIEMDWRGYAMSFWVGNKSICARFHRHLSFVFHLE